MFFPEYQPRLQAIEALRSVQAGARPANELAVVADELESLSKRLEPGAGIAFSAYGELVRAVGHLHLWGAAVRDAEMDADRHLRAARQRARDVVRRGVGGPSGPDVEKVARKLTEVSAEEEVEACFEDLLAVRLPLPFPGPPAPAKLDTSELTGKARPEPRAVVAVLRFSLGTDPVGEPKDIRANLLYDLSVEVRLSQWPPRAKAVEVSPLTVEPYGTIEAPTFTIEESSSGALTFSRTGRLCVRLPHDSLARPLEISYGVHLLPAEGEMPKVVVQGQSHLRFRCEEHDHLWGGNRAVAQAVRHARDQARPHGLPDEELASFLALLGAVGLVAHESLADNIFPGDWSEADFQKEMKSRLRTNRNIGSDLDEHSHVAGGITDLSFHGVRLELKVDPQPVDLEGALEASGQQLSQYVVGSDRRCGVLAVLCRPQKGAAPGSLENDIGVRFISPPTGGDRPIVLGIVLIRGDLPRPSSLSRYS
ncbi:MAG: hypothetical protein ABUT39_00615 [Acidobacteriota bacterium]